MAAAPGEYRLLRDDGLALAVAPATDDTPGAWPEVIAPGNTSARGLALDGPDCCTAAESKSKLWRLSFSEASAAAAARLTLMRAPDAASEDDDHGEPTFVLRLTAPGRGPPWAHPKGAYLALDGMGRLQPVNSARAALALRLALTDGNGAVLRCAGGRGALRSVDGELRLMPGDGGSADRRDGPGGRLQLVEVPLCDPWLPSPVALTGGPPPDTQPLYAPLRVHLRAHHGGYICGARPTLDARADLACCCESLELLISQSPQQQAGQPAAACDCGPRGLLGWLSGARRRGRSPSTKAAPAPPIAAQRGTPALLRALCGGLVAAEPTGQLVAAPPGRSLGGEAFRLHVLSANSVALSTDRGAAADARFVCAEADGSLNASRATARAWESFQLELVSGRPLLLRSAAHGSFIARPRSARGLNQGHGGPAGATRPAVPVTAPACAAGSPALADCGWMLRAHGDNLYSIVAARTPPARMDAAASIPGRGRAVPAGPDTYLLVDPADGAVLTSAAPAAHFPNPGSLWKVELLAGAGGALAGWALRTHAAVRGARRYLSVDPLGGLHAVRRCAHAWETFAIADLPAAQDAAAAGLRAAAAAALTATQLPAELLPPPPMVAPVRRTPAPLQALCAARLVWDGALPPSLLALRDADAVGAEFAATGLMGAPAPPASRCAGAGGCCDGCDAGEGCAGQDGTADAYGTVHLPDLLCAEVARLCAERAPPSPRCREGAGPSGSSPGGGCKRRVLVELDMPAGAGWPFAALGGSASRLLMAAGYHCASCQPSAVAATAAEGDAAACGSGAGGSGADAGATDPSPTPPALQPMDARVNPLHHRFLPLAARRQNHQRGAGPAAELIFHARGPPGLGATLSLACRVVCLAAVSVAAASVGRGRGNGGDRGGGLGGRGAGFGGGACPAGAAAAGFSFGAALELARGDGPLPLTLTLGAGVRRRAGA